MGNKTIAHDWEPLVKEFLPKLGSQGSVLSLRLFLRLIGLAIAEWHGLNATLEEAYAVLTSDLEEAIAFPEDLQLPLRQFLKANQLTEAGSLGAIYEYIAGAVEKKKSGRYYTDARLADYVVQSAFAELPLDSFHHELKILDPAIGGGAFLLSAFRQLKERDTRFCLYGLDLDLCAVDATRIGLWLLAGCPLTRLDVLWPNIKQGNALLCSFSERFDCVIGNPPWEILKPNSREFFAAYDKQFWTYGKQKALIRQREILAENKEAKRIWQVQQDDYRAISALVKQGTFQFQGTGDLNAYKLFLELGFSLLLEGRVLAHLIPSGIYCDQGAKELRSLFLTQAQWLALTSFENKEALFDIHRSFKFCAIVIKKGGTTGNIKTSFQSTSPDSLKPPFSYPGRLVEKLSPGSRALLEVDCKRDLELLESLSERSLRLGDCLADGRLNFKRELDMTLQSALFLERQQIESEGYKSDCYGHWLKGRWHQAEAGQELSLERLESACGQFQIALSDLEATALPLYEGRMVGQFNCSAKSWLAGKGRRAVWQQNQLANDLLSPQYLISPENYQGFSDTLQKREKIGFLAVGSSTNMRSMIASCLPNLPCGNSVATISPKNNDALLTLSLTGLLNSFVFDYVLRARLSGNNLNCFILEECYLPGQLFNQLDELSALAAVSAALNLNHPRFAQTELALLSQTKFRPPAKMARMQLKAVADALSAHLYGLSEAEFGWILRDCQIGESSLRTLSKKSEKSPKGFWRVDKDQPVDKRLTNLALQSFSELHKKGLEQFLADNLGQAKDASDCHIEQLQFHSARLARLKLMGDYGARPCAANPV